MYTRFVDSWVLYQFKYLELALFLYFFLFWFRIEHLEVTHGGNYCLVNIYKERLDPFFFFFFTLFPPRSWWSCVVLCLRLKNWHRRTTCSCSSAPSHPGVRLTTCRGERAPAKCSWQSPDTASASTSSNTSTVNLDLHRQNLLTHHHQLPSFTLHYLR